jgi:hypothetical protein
MTSPNPDKIAQVVISYFLRSLMRVERERNNLSQKAAALMAGWSGPSWGAFERGERAIDKETWGIVIEALDLDPTALVRRLNGFINRYPSIWLERRGEELHICERPVTSPRGIRSGKVVNIELNPIRPALYQELSDYTPTPGEIIAAAVSLDYYDARTPPALPSGRVSRSDTEPGQPIDIQDVILTFSPEKLALLERVIDKFQRFSAKELAMAYQHFSLSLKKH